MALEPEALHGLQRFFESFNLRDPKFRLTFLTTSTPPLVLASSYID